jgi:GMP synthase-like glutamine amidotransferase
VRVLTIVHEDDAGPGVFVPAAREHGAELVEWAPPSEPPPSDALDGYAGAVVLGAAAHPDQEDEHPWLRDVKGLIRELLNHRTPVLGVCLGAELLAEATGGGVVREPGPHVGWAETVLTQAGRNDPVLGVLPERFFCFQWHSYQSELPPGGVPLALDGSQLDAFRIGDAWGIQFHAEVTPQTIGEWLDELEDHADAAAAGFAVGPGRDETARRIDASGEVGRALFRAFLERL